VWSNPLELPSNASRDSTAGIGDKSSAPAGYKTPAAVDAFGHFIPGMALGQQQDQPRPPGIFGAIGPAIGSPRQLHKLRIRQSDRVSHGHDYSLQMVVTVNWCGHGPFRLDNISTDYPFYRRAVAADWECAWVVAFRTITKQHVDAVFVARVEPTSGQTRGSSHGQASGLGCTF
jgi:hypothetical protein